MYRWPQGRIVRLVALALVVLVVLDLAFNGAWRGFGTAAEATKADEALRQTIWGSVFTALAVAAFAVGVWMVGFWKRSVDFLIDVDGEMGRVEWPTWPVLWRTTLVVAIVMVILGLLIIGVDWLCQAFVSALNALGGGN
jgi:preprotein translocase SecE subunit